MESHLHLAEARGSLQAPNSPVQDLALRLLRVIRTNEHHQSRSEQRRDAAKMALVEGASLDRMAIFFPEFFPDNWEEVRAFEQAKKDDGTYDIDKVDGAHINWGVASPEEDDDISRWIAEREQGSMTTTMLDDWR